MEGNNDGSGENAPAKLPNTNKKLTIRSRNTIDRRPPKAGRRGSGPAGGVIFGGAAEPKKIGTESRLKRVGPS